MLLSNVVISNQLTGNSEGGRRRKIIWTLPWIPSHRGGGVRGGGQGDNLGQYSQATGELCNKKGSRQNHEEDLQWVALPDQPTLRQSEQNVEAARCVNMCQLKSGVHTRKYKLMTGRVEVLNSVKALSGSVPPCPLLPTSSPLRRSEGMAHRARLTPEISSYRYSVCAWKRVCDNVCVCHHTNERVIDTVPRWCACIYVSMSCFVTELSLLLWWSHWHRALELGPFIDSRKHNTPAWKSSKSSM